MCCQNHVACWRIDYRNILFNRTVPGKTDSGYVQWLIIFSVQPKNSPIFDCLILEQWCSGSELIIIWQLLAIPLKQYNNNELQRTSCDNNHSLHRLFNY